MQHRNTFTIIDDPEDGLLELYYSSYNSVFTNEAEKESLSGFKDLLAMNSEHTWAREFIILAEERGTTMGGASWAAYNFGDQAVVMLSYMHTEPFARRKGYAKRMLNELLGATELHFKVPVRTAILESEPEAIDAWVAMGFQSTDVEYVAPTVDGSDGVIDHLTLMYHGEKPTPDMLYEYLRAYFDMSYFRGFKDSTKEPDTAETLKRILGPHRSPSTS